jgi:hypothetical protein
MKTKEAGRGFGYMLEAQFRRRTAFRYGLKLLFSLGDRLGNIKRSVTGSPFQNIGVTVIARANDVHVLILIPARQPARTSPVAITPLVGQNPGTQRLGKLDIGIEEITPG